MKTLPRLIAPLAVLALSLGLFFSAVFAGSDTVNGVYITWTGYMTHGGGTYTGTTISTADEDLNTIWSRVKLREYCNGSWETDFEGTYYVFGGQSSTKVGSGGYNTDWWDCLLTDHYLEYSGTHRWWDDFPSISEYRYSYDLDTI